MRMPVDNRCFAVRFAPALRICSANASSNRCRCAGLVDRLSPLLRFATAGTDGVRPSAPNVRSTSLSPPPVGRFVAAPAVSCIHAVTKLKAAAGVPSDNSLELFGRINLMVDAFVSGILQDVKLDLARCCAHVRKHSTAKELANFFEWMTHWSRDNVVSGDAAMRRLLSLCRAALAEISSEIDERKLKKQEDVALKGRVAQALKQASSVLAKRPQLPGV